MDNVSLYFAGPLGFSEVGRSFMYKEMVPIVLDLGFEVIDPWKLTPDEKIAPITEMPYGAERKAAWEKVNPVIGENNAKGIEKATGMIAILDGTDVDSGTASEIGYGSALGKRILGYKGDFRLTSDNEGSLVNLQVEYFIKKNGGKIITQIADFKPSLKSLFDVALKV